ncbi:heterotrimeric G protein alpha subunit 4 [Ramaria rubella]|nr:heterotrimeric G protein alpha subunit 4 [Ramaria rubella]
MGSCLSSPAGDPEQIRQNKAVERDLKEAKAKLESQVKVLLLGSGDSGKSTILKQMRLIHKVPFTVQEIEFYRQLVFNNITYGLRVVMEAMDDLDLKVSDENLAMAEMVHEAPDLRDGEPFPVEYMLPLETLWKDPGIERAIARGNEAALPENLTYFFSDLPRLFDPSFKPTDQDIIRSRARTTGITETIFKLRTHSMHMLDVGGQKSERRKWIHCFQDVTSILFLVSLSGYDQCLVEDKDANQMQDAMTIWDSICHSQWFKHTSIILFLNKDDIFSEKIKHSNIKNTFPDYEGSPGDAAAGREYFKKRFTRLSAKANRINEREIYTHFTNATDTALLKVVMAAVEGFLRHVVLRSTSSFLAVYAFLSPLSITLRTNLHDAALI